MRKQRLQREILLVAVLPGLPGQLHCPVPSVTRKELSCKLDANQMQKHISYLILTSLRVLPGAI